MIGKQNEKQTETPQHSQGVETQPSQAAHAEALRPKAVLGQSDSKAGLGTPNRVL